MDTSLTPNYANLFMNRFESRALEAYHLKPLVWKRFIDDIFMVWIHGEDSLNHFTEYLISLHESRRFTHESSYTNINFLDTFQSSLMRIENSLLLYTTILDTHLYFEYSSAPLSIVLEKDHMDSLKRHFNRAKQFKQSDLLDTAPDLHLTHQSR